MTRPTGDSSPQEKTMSTTKAPSLCSDRSTRAVVRAFLAIAMLGTVLSTTVLNAAPASAEGPCGIAVYSGDFNRVGNLVFEDDNNNGRYEPAAGESGIGGATVELWRDVDFDDVFEPAGDDAAGRSCTTTTNSTGNYWFHDVASGVYFITVANVPVGYQSSTGATTSPTIDNTDDGVSRLSYDAVSEAFTLGGTTTQPTNEAAPGASAGSDEAAANSNTEVTSDIDSNLTIDFGFYNPPTPTCMGIGNRVWLDLNNNGIAEGGESGINGVTAQLFAADAGGDPTGPVLESTTTIDGGYYLFSCVDPGTYVVVIPASNFDSGQPLAGLNPTVVGPAGDQGNDGALADNGDVVSGPTVLAAGSAPVAEPDKPAISINFDNPADDAVNTEIDFGFSGMTIGNRVWLENGTPNGIQDVGEAGISGINVELWASDGTGPTGIAPIASTTTDTNGYYLFKGVTPGEYVVRIPARNFDAILENHVSTAGNGTAPDADANPADRDDNGDGAVGGPVDSRPVTLSAASEPTGESDVASAMDSFPSDDNANVTVDFGFVDNSPEPPGAGTAAIGDRVWIDANKNGVQDSGETGVPNVTVTLRDNAGNTLETDVTDADGNYRFDELLPGTYVVCFDFTTLPTGMVPTTSDTGANDAVDSDPGATGCTPPVTLAAGDEDITIDLGIYSSPGTPPPVVPNVDLAIDKTGVFSSGKVTWTIKVTNNGPGRANDTIVVTDNLPSDLVFESATGTGFACSATGAALRCTYSGGLDAAATATLTVVTKMASVTDCTVANTASVSYSGAGLDPQANNSDSASLTSACVKTSTTTKPNLPVTGGNVMIFATTALALALAGWKFLGVSSQAKADRLRDRIEG
jgi:uncharacterized repeat protein (TIGR01451 family)